MSKELDALYEIKRHHINMDAFVKYENGDETQYRFVTIRDMFPQEFKTLEKALEEKETQDSIIATIKGIITFAEKLPDVEADDNGDFSSIFCAVSMRIQRQMENQERKLFRNWVQKECFPKELQVLEIIKKKNVNVRAFKKVMLMKQNDDVKLRSYNSQNDKDEDDLTQEEYDSLKEVLL